MTATVDILIPTFERTSALAVTATSLIYQNFQDFRLIISDQGDSDLVSESMELKTIFNVLEDHGRTVEVHHHLPRRGMAEQRQFLLDQVTAPYALFIDDDIILEAYGIENLVKAIREEDCGFVGYAVIGLSYKDDHRPGEEEVEFWEGRVLPELVSPESPSWQRYKLHNAANVYHVQNRLGITPENPRKYKVAWTGGCALYNTEYLRSIGGFQFWKELPTTHCGEDVLAQVRVMARYGGCGLMPTGAYHLELPTTLPDRSIDAPKVLDLIDAQL